MKRVGRLASCGAAAAMVLALGTNLAWAQPGGGFRGRSGPGGFPGGDGTLGLIQQQEVQQEIELSEDQQAELRTLGETIRDEVRNEMQGMFQNMRDLSDEERQAKFDEIRTRFEAINKDAEARMKTVLMPHQFDRLKQIDVQSRVQTGGASALTEGELAETLGLTEAQRDQIREKSEEVQKDLNEKIGQLRLEARNQLLEVLTPEQRAKLESMMGTDFALAQPQFGPPGGRNAFGRGNRGGRNRNRGGDAPATEDRGT
jgi:Spy/CpxP family protein refolding chaperone